jgi:hypothetical protein
MKKNPAMRLALCVSALMLIKLTPVMAQENGPQFQVGINAGTFIYQGDLAPSPIGSFKTPRFACGFYVGKSLTHTISTRIDLSFGSLEGQDIKYNIPSWRQRRNFKFYTPVSEVTAALVYNPVGTDRFLDPYFFIGAGYSYVNIKRDYSNYDAAYFVGDRISSGLKIDMAHDLPRMIPITNLGVGIAHPLNKHISVTGEATYRLMSTDYLDGFSQSANPNQNDHYYKFSVGVLYKFFNTFSYDCPTVF